jgi:hypothetical protein
MCQGTVVVLNLVLIAWIMLPSYREAVLPGLPEGLSRSYYYLPTLHAGLGTVAQLLGLFIALRAGTNLLPEVLRFRNYKLWMRAELILWWAVILLGITTYVAWL